MRKLIDFTEKLRKHSPGAANLAITAAIRQVVPLAASMAIRVDELTDTRTQLSMPRRWRVKNHLGDIYFGAEMTLMELTMAALLLKRFPLGEFNILVKRVESDFVARAKTRVHAVCEPPADLLTTLEEGLREKGSKAEAWVPVQLLGEDNAVVCSARFLASLKKL
ncbi:YiiD C-terminal domain-containing protein [Myxococcaceae bacterium GXIMD 01537]